MRAVVNKPEERTCPDPISELAEKFQVSPNFMKKRLEFEKLIKGKYQ